MCKELTFNCDRKKCNFSKTVEKKGRFPLSITKWPKEFHVIKNNGTTYHVCETCKKEHEKLTKDWIKQKVN